MKSFIIYRDVDGKILKTGSCSDKDFMYQNVGAGETIIEGVANDYAQKIVNGRIVDKTPDEIIADDPQIPFEQQRARITNEQWWDILNRVDKLENKA